MKCRQESEQETDTEMKFKTAVAEQKALRIFWTSMLNLKEFILIAYKLVGDYYIPVTELSDEECSIGKYGRMHREYLKEYNPRMFNDLVLTAQLWTYLADLNEQAQNRGQFIIRQIQETENVTDELKEHDQMVWVRAMNSIYNRAEEIVIHELVLQ